MGGVVLPPCYFYDATDVENLIPGSPAFSKSSLNIGKFAVHVLLKDIRVRGTEYNSVGISPLEGIAITVSTEAIVWLPAKRQGGNTALSINRKLD